MFRWINSEQITQYDPYNDAFFKFRFSNSKYYITSKKGSHILIINGILCQQMNFISELFKTSKRSCKL
jgi:hypothetical protein